MPRPFVRIRIVLIETRGDDLHLVLRLLAGDAVVQAADDVDVGSSTTAYRMLKIAVFAPMATASVRITAAAKPGDLKMFRRAMRRSVSLELEDPPSRSVESPSCCQS